MNNDLEDIHNLIYRAFQLACVNEEQARDYTSEELEELLVCLTMSSLKLKKLPGGKEASERVYARRLAEAKAKLASRGK